MHLIYTTVLSRCLKRMKGDNMKNKRQTIQIGAIVVLLMIIAAEVIFIISGNGKIKSETENLPSDAVVGQISNAQTSVKINNEGIPAYRIEGAEDVYMADSDLALFGFVCKLEKASYTISNPNGVYSMSSDAFVDNLDGQEISEADKKIAINGEEFVCYKNSRVLMVPVQALAKLGKELQSVSTKTIYLAFGTEEEIEKSQQVSNNEIAVAEGKIPQSTEAATESTVAANNGKQGEISLSGGQTQTSSSGNGNSNGNSKIIVLDPGHGKSSGSMSASEKQASGWVQNSSGAWGEWRHYKIGSSTVDCEGDGCNHRVTPNSACWYPIGNGDRDTEPAINLNNALAAKKYLEQMGYTVRMTRTSNDENPSITRRIQYCYPNMDSSQTADAALFLCIHSNAGGGTGSAYIQLDGEYDQRGIKSSYVSDGNTLGKLCNDKIVAETSMSRHGDGVIGGEPELIAFCKSPVTCGYLEIGFFDNSSDLSKLKSDSDAIGKAIAEGVDEFCKSR